MKSLKRGLLNIYAEMRKDSVCDLANGLSFLSALYVCEPKKNALLNWKELLSGDIPSFLETLRDALEKIDVESEEEMEEVLWDWTRLFIGPYKLLSPPWESVYTSPKRLMMQESYQKVKDIYNKSGLAVGNPNVAPDHIGAELNFLAILLRKIVAGDGNSSQYSDTITSFLTEHIMVWVPQFTEDMEESAGTILYKSLAQATRTCILECKNYITLGNL